MRLGHCLLAPSGMKKIDRDLLDWKFRAIDRGLKFSIDPFSVTLGGPRKSKHCRSWGGPKISEKFAGVWEEFWGSVNGGFQAVKRWFEFGLESALPHHILTLGQPQVNLLFTSVLPHLNPAQPGIFMTILEQSIRRDEFSFWERGFCHGFLCEFFLWISWGFPSLSTKDKNPRRNPQQNPWERKKTHKEKTRKQIFHGIVPGFWGGLCLCFVPP